MEPSAIVIAAIAIAAGGLLKGATGAGAPILGVPILALLFDLPTAVSIFAVINLVSNIWQCWSFRKSLADKRLGLVFVGAGGVGALIGTVALVRLPADLLMGGLASIVFLYIGLRLNRPDWRLQRETGRRLALPVGFAAGIMQGAGGLTAPVSVTFLNAMRMDRSEFIATITLFFLGLALVQVPALFSVGVLTPDLFLVGALGTLPLFAAMPVGAFAASRLGKETFDRVILTLLALVALRLGWAALT